ncbi:unnamed protein product [Microthlaspi erraticum]|uniref:PGG domain-containing protein n=1 Tax=Microthlaspi erraticum TaxID=1685480 RepID=A0A6D2J4T0_9BRAS|nr:unnamed protein product [Microthlaspi erraticum]
MQNKDGFTPLDMVRAKGNHMNFDTEKIIRRSGGKSKDALSKVKTSSQYLRSPITFREYCSITTVRYRSAISDGTRNALLVISTLVMSTTYEAKSPSDSESRVEPDSRVEPHRSPILLMLHSGFNTLAFWLSLTLTLVLLPLGREYIWCYILISVPLFCSYGISMFLNAVSTQMVIPSLLIMAVLFGFPCYILFVFFKWKRSIQLRSPKPKSQTILEAWTTAV